MFTGSARTKGLSLTFKTIIFSASITCNVLKGNLRHIFPLLPQHSHSAKTSFISTYFTEATRLKNKESIFMSSKNVKKKKFKEFYFSAVDMDVIVQIV